MLAWDPLWNKRLLTPVLRAVQLMLKSHCTRWEKNVVSISCFKVAALLHS